MIFWLLYIIAEAFIQFKRIKEGNSPNYIQLFIIRGMASILHGAFILDVQDTHQALIMWGWQIFSFYTIFDILLNKLRGKAWNHRGKASGIFKKFNLDKLPLVIWDILKVISLILAIIFYIKGLEYWSF